MNELGGVCRLKCRNYRSRPIPIVGTESSIERVGQEISQLNKPRGFGIHKERCLSERVESTALLSWESRPGASSLNPRFKGSLIPAPISNEDAVVEVALPPPRPKM